MPLYFLHDLDELLDVSNQLLEDGRNLAEEVLVDLFLCLEVDIVQKED